MIRKILDFFRMRNYHPPMSDTQTPVAKHYLPPSYSREAVDEAIQSLRAYLNHPDNGVNSNIVAAVEIHLQQIESAVETVSVTVGEIAVGTPVTAGNSE